jgi:hypothetical protein
LKGAEVIFGERYGLYKKMPILADVADLQSIDEEWRSHSLNPDLNEQLRAEEYWKVIFK